MPLASGHLTEKIAQPHFLSPGTAGLGRDWFRDWFRFHSRALPLRGAKVEEGCCIFLQARHGQTDGHRQEPGHPGDRGCAFSFTPSVSLIPARQTGISGSLWKKKKKKSNKKTTKNPEIIIYALEMVQKHTRMSKGPGCSKRRMDLILKVFIYLFLQSDKLHSEQKQARRLLVTFRPGWVYKLNYVASQGYVVGPCLKNKTKMKERTKLYSKVKLQYRSVNSRLRLSKDQLVLGLSA